ncbi:Uncharacterised protein [Chromobacterium violaceum]|uniref:Uncharacterized protein n=1 Tax=Chromobacterium violaceum TaxID=536 RepID=A0A3S4HMM8_CHRVL|nr:Uncharacterised protein [Chromobacterium violaceum]
MTESIITQQASAEDSLYEQLSADNHLLRQQVEQLQSQLHASDLERKELRNALSVALLPPESRNNVIQLVRESAA